jgi:hypothetical protein
LSWISDHPPETTWQEIKLYEDSLADFRKSEEQRKARKFKRDTPRFSDIVILSFPFGEF